MKLPWQPHVYFGKSKGATLNFLDSWDFVFRKATEAESVLDTPRNTVLLHQSIPLLCPANWRRTAFFRHFNVQRIKVKPEDSNESSDYLSNIMVNSSKQKKSSASLPKYIYIYYVPVEVFASWFKYICFSSQDIGFIGYCKKSCLWNGKTLEQSPPPRVCSPTQRQGAKSIHIIIVCPIPPECPGGS